MPPIEHYVRRGVNFTDPGRSVEGVLKPEGAVELGRRINRDVFNGGDEVRVRFTEGRYTVIHKKTGRFVTLEPEDYSNGDFFFYLQNVSKEKRGEEGK